MTALKILKMFPAVVTPAKATEGAACFDLRAFHHSNGEPLPEGTVYAIPPGQSMEISTGIKMEVPPGHVCLLFSRSGHGAQFGVRLGNCVGVVDSDYRGEVKAIMHNDSKKVFDVVHGERCMQAMVVQLPDTTVELVTELSETLRGEGGLGSTGND